MFNLFERIIFIKNDSYDLNFFTKLFWTKDDKPLLASTRLNITYEPKTGDIDFEFDFVKPIDAGLYKCRGENIYGEDTTLSSFLIIDVPNVDERPQNINPDKNLTLPLPDFVSFEPDQIVDPSKGKPPKFIIHLPVELTFFDGDKVNMKCKVEGYPTPKVFFFINCNV
jgi:hypothetical protein